MTVEEDVDQVKFVLDEDGEKVPEKKLKGENEIRQRRKQAEMVEELVIND